METLKEDLGKMETAASVQHKEHLLPQNMHCVQCLPILLMAVWLTAGCWPWDKVRCPCRHQLCPSQLLLRNAVTSELSTHRRLIGHSGDSSCCPGLWHSIWPGRWGLSIISSTIWVAGGMEKGHEVSWHMKGQMCWQPWGFWAHRACLLGVTVTT